MWFIETPVFTKRLLEALDDDSYAGLQKELYRKPDAGSVIPGSAGLRKIRWGTKHTGKRGGLRVIYYWDKPTDSIYFLLIYKKSTRDDLTPSQLQTLSALVKEEFK